MRVAVLALAVPAAVAAGPIQLAKSNFEAEVFGSPSKAAFVKFFAPWCGHCKRMKPAWDALGDAYAGSDDVLIGDVDCTQEQDICSQYGVRGYPTVKYWRAGERTPQDYRGGRDLSALKQHAAELGGAAAPEPVPTPKPKPAAQVAKGAKFEKCSTCGFEAAFPKLSTFVTDEISSFPALSLGYYRGNHPRITFYDEHGERAGSVALGAGDSGATVAEKLGKFGITKGTPKPGYKVYDASAGCVAFRQTTADGSRYPSGDRDCLQRIMPGAGVGYCECEEGKRVKLWVHKDRQTTTCRRLCSEEIPWLKDGEEQGGPALDRPSDEVAGPVSPPTPGPTQETQPQAFKDGEVAELNPESFAKALDMDKDVLVMFYAPWCGHCKKMMPQYLELGKHFAGKNVIIGKYDAPANADLAKKEGVKSFPWIKYYGRNGKVEKYDGERDKSSMIAYVDERLGFM